MLAKKLLLSPLVHFFVLGALIFAFFNIVNEDTVEPTSSTDVIALTNEQAENLIDQFSRTWNRPPTADELNELMRSWALQEAFVREALQLGLDRGDEVIRQRLSLKMQYISEAGAGALAVDDVVLKAFLQENPESFEKPARIGFEQIVLPEASRAVIDDILARLLEGEDPTSLGQPTLLPGAVPLTQVPIVDRTFGTDFGQSLSALPLGQWEGPVQSGYGVHLVRVLEKDDAYLPPLADIRDSVEADWRAKRAQEMRESYGNALLERYSINLPSAEEVLKK